MKSSVVTCAHREPVDAGVGLCVRSLPSCLSGAIRESTGLIRDMTPCGFLCCQRERAQDALK